MSFRGFSNDRPTQCQSPLARALCAGLHVVVKDTDRLHETDEIACIELSEYDSRVAGAYSNENVAKASEKWLAGSRW